MSKMTSTKHKHFIYKIEYRGKADSVDVECVCGHKECFALWDWDATAEDEESTCPKGWDRQYWDQSGRLVSNFLDLTHSGIIKWQASGCYEIKYDKTI